MHLVSISSDFLFNKFCVGCMVQHAVEFLNERNRDDEFFRVVTEKLSMLQVSLFVC